MMLRPPKARGQIPSFLDPTAFLSESVATCSINTFRRVYKI